MVSETTKSIFIIYLFLFFPDQECFFLIKSQLIELFYLLCLCVFGEHSDRNARKLFITFTWIIYAVSILLNIEKFISTRNWQWQNSFSIICSSRFRNCFPQIKNWRCWDYWNRWTDSRYRTYKSKDNECDQKEYGCYELMTAITMNQILTLISKRKQWPIESHFTHKMPHM